MDPNPLERRGKLVIGALMIAILALSLIFLQQRFDSGDYERAILMLAHKAPADRWSINEELVLRSKAQAVECEPKMISSFRGTLEVTCRLGQAGTYRFAVDLVRKRVEPLDVPSRALMETVQTKARGEEPDGG